MMERKTIFVIAEKEESVLIDRLFPNAMPEGAELLVTGVGAINVLRSLGSIDRSTHLINVGYAGSANFAIGTWVRVTESLLHHPNFKYPEPCLPLQVPAALPAVEMIEAPCYSGVDFVLQSPFKDCVFDMELAFIMAMGFQNVESYKYVSDNLSLHEYREVFNS